MRPRSQRADFGLACWVDFARLTSLGQDLSPSLNAAVSLSAGLGTLLIRGGGWLRGGWLLDRAR